MHEYTKNLFYMAHLVLCMGKFGTMLFIRIYAIMLLCLRTNKTMSHLKSIDSGFSCPRCRFKDTALFLCPSVLRHRFDDILASA